MNILSLTVTFALCSTTLASATITRTVRYELGEDGSMAGNFLPQDTGGGASQFTNQEGGTVATVSSFGAWAPGSTAFLEVMDGGWSAADLWNTLPTDNFAIGIFAKATNLPANTVDVMTLGTADAALKLSLTSSGWAASAHNVAWIGPAGGVTHSFASSQWTHLAMIRRSGTTTFYINGNAQGSWGGVPAHGTGLLCATPGGGSYFQGSIDQARVLTFDDNSEVAEVLAALWGAPTLPPAYQQTFPTVVGRRYIATFELSPAAGSTQLPSTVISVVGASPRIQQSLPTALPQGGMRAPFRIAFSADSTDSTVQFSFGSLTSPQILNLQLLEAIEPLSTTVPRPSQQAQIDRRYGMFIHYGLNTFANSDWTDGTLPESIYAPTELNVDQWVKGARDAGMRHIILTAKHHEGFCIWDSPWTTYDVGATQVKTDVIALAAAACAKYGIKLGIYYSLWDRNFPGYLDDAAYNQYILRHFAELLGNYGPICELWLDGGGNKPNETQWPNSELYDLMRRLQPDCLVSTNWGSFQSNRMSYFPSDFRTADPTMPAFPDSKIYSNAGKDYYMPYESTVTLSSIDVWFYHTFDNAAKPLSKLLDYYYTATAQNNIFILNAPPDRRGLLRDVDLNRLYELRDRLGIHPGMPMPKQLTGTFTTNSSETWENAVGSVGPQFAVDGNPATRWAGGPVGATSASFEINFGAIREFDRVLIDEYEEAGSGRIRQFELQAWNGNSWTTFHSGTTAGRHKLIDVARQKTSRLQLRVSDSTNAISLHEFQVYDAGHAFSTWRDQNFATADALPAAEMEADPDGDQLPNRLEFALGSDPNASNTLPAPQKFGEMIKLTLPWNPDAGPNFGAISYSLDLASWFDATSPTHTGVEFLNSPTSSRTWQIDPQQHPKWFYRLK